MPSGSTTDPEFDTRNVLAVSLDLTQAGYGVSQGQALYDELLLRTASLPGVFVASLTHSVPLSSSGRLVTVVAEDGTGLGDDQTLSGVGSGLVSPGHFETLGMPLLRGRYFTADDAGGIAPVAVVNELMARRLWPTEDPLGQRFRIAGSTDERLEVVGLVTAVKYRRLGEDPPPTFYRSLRQQYSPVMTLLMRTATDPRQLIGPVRQHLRTLYPDAAPVAITTLEDQMEGELRARVVSRVCFSQSVGWGCSSAAWGSMA